MDKRIKSRILAIGMATSSVVTGYAQTQEIAENKDINESFEGNKLYKSINETNKKANITYKEIADFVFEAAKEYNPLINKNKIIEGFESKENQKANRLDTLVMISRGFGELSKPTGHNNRVMDKNVKYTDIPESAKSSIDNLINGGVMVNTKDQKLNGNELMTIGEIDTIIRRIWAFKGSNLKDDFYNTINKNKLEKSVIPNGKSETGGFTSLSQETNKKVADIVKEIVNGNHTKGSTEQKIKDMYNNMLDMKHRNEVGNKPIKKYLNEIDNVGTIEELKEVIYKINKELGVSVLLNLISMEDSRDRNRNQLNLMNAIEIFEEDGYDTNNKYYKAGIEFYEKMLVFSGETKEQASKNISKYMDISKQLSKTFWSETPETMQKIMTIEEVNKKFPSLDISKLITSSGYALPKDIALQGVNTIEAIDKLFNNDNLDAFKAISKINLSTSYAQDLSQEYLDAYERYLNPGSEKKDNNPTEEEVSEIVANQFSEYIGEIYVKKYFSESSKKDIEKMCKDLVNIYKEKIQNLDWMAESTKKEAIKKLDSMKFLIGYPDKWESPMDNVEIKGKSEGGNYLENIISIRRSKLTESIKNQNKPVDKYKFKLTSFMVNAAYSMSFNYICFPAGMLQAPFYDANASYEKNLGAIGLVIGHEISHAFDNNGSKNDFEGNVRDWWTKEDYEKFEKKCAKVVDFYEGYESAPGIKMNGEHTLGENVSDIGGMSAALDLLSKKENPNYDEFFKSYTTSYLRAFTRQHAEDLAEGDEHSSTNLRVNRVLSNFEEFYKTYNIKEGDGMYVAPEDRVHVWGDTKNSEKVKIKNIIGSNRYETAVKVSKEGWDTSNTVIIVNGTDKHMVDGLTATPLANIKNAPILLSNGKSIDNNTMDEIKRLKASNIIIIGGEESIHNSVIEQLNNTNKSISVKRIGGKTRYETSLNVAKEVSKINKIETIYISAGDGEADALSISSVAGKEKSPIILTKKDGLDKEAYDYIKSKNINNAYIIGGEQKISSKAVSQINDVISNDISKNRLAGENRQETNAKVINKFYDDTNLKAVVLAKDTNLIDALAVGPFAAKENIPVVIATDKLNEEQNHILNKKKSDRIYQVGGGIKSSVVYKLRGLLNK